MEVNKSLLVKIFSEQVVELYRDMRIVYPNNISIKTGLTLVEQIKTFNPKMMISKYKEGVNDEYYDHIIKGDLEFFINKDYSMDCKKQGYVGKEVKETTAWLNTIKELYKDPFGDKFHIKIIFCNGGDRTADNVPEQEKFKNDEWVNFEFGVGGDYKKNSSSDILKEYRNAKTERNWGYYRVIHQIGKEVKVKELVIEPGKELSNQYHDKRNELWYVMKGEVVMNGVVQKEHGPAFLIPKGYWHLAKNVSDKPCHILECQYGEECIEDDIHRQPLNENDSQ